IALTRATARSSTSHAGRVVRRPCPSAASSDRDRGFALGRRVDPRNDSIAGRAGGDRAAAPAYYSATRVSGSMADSRSPYTNHTQPAEAAQRQENDSPHSGTNRAASRDSRAAGRTQRRGPPLSPR